MTICIKLARICDFNSHKRALKHHIQGLYNLNYFIISVGQQKRKHCLRINNKIVNLC